MAVLAGHKTKDDESNTQMTNSIAIGLALTVVGFFAIDHFLLHLDAGTFVLRKTIALIQYVAFWR